MDTNDRVTADTRDHAVADAHGKSAMANIVGWLALIISIIALVLAWMAYNNASQENLGEMIQDELQQGTNQIEEGATDTFNDNTTAPSTNDGTMNDETTAPQDEATMPEENTTTPAQ